jgi:membrane protein
MYLTMKDMDVKNKITKLRLFDISKAAFKEWRAKDPVKESAVIAYYSIFSIPGLFVVIVVVAGFFFGRDVINNQIANQISESLGKDTAGQIQNIVAQQTGGNKPWWAAIINSVMGLLFIDDCFIWCRVYA